VAYILKRLGYYLLAFWASVTLNFLLPRLMPGDPVSRMFARSGARLTQTQALQLRRLFGLDDAPLWQQYLRYLKSILTGDLGVSISRFPAPVSEVIGSQIGWTVLLGGVALVIAAGAGSLLGILAAWRRGGVADSILVPLLVFLGSFVPVIGALISGAVAVLLALVALGPVQALIMLGIVLLVQQLESNILQPLIMGKAVSLHPLAVIFSVAGGSMIFGAVGALFAVPTLAVVNAVVRYLANRDWEKEAPREEEFLFPHEVARREQAEEKAQERQESVKNLASRVPSRQKAEEPENQASEASDSSED